MFVLCDFRRRSTEACALVCQRERTVECNADSCEHRDHRGHYARVFSGVETRNPGSSEYDERRIKIVQVTLGDADCRQHDAATDEKRHGWKPSAPKHVV